MFRVLMVNGRDDFLFPLDTNQKPLFEALGTKEPDKKHILYDGGHSNLVTRPDLIGEVLDWFDRYLGPVESVRATSRGLEPSETLRLPWLGAHGSSSRTSHAPRLSAATIRSTS